MHYPTEKIITDTLKILFDELGLKTSISSTTIIYGANDGINSLSLVRLIVEIEEIVFQKYGKSIVIADDRSLSLKNSPFRTVESLTNYIDSLLHEND